MLLLSSQASEERRAKILTDVQGAIARDEGEIVTDQDWGVRPLAYEIDRRGDAEYHLLQFAGPASLVAELDRSLRIADGVVRFRIIRQPPNMPPPAPLHGTPEPVGVDDEG
jgi:small subunit ribosomal protein S6